MRRKADELLDAAAAGVTDRRARMDSHWRNQTRDACQDPPRGGGPLNEAVRVRPTALRNLSDGRAAVRG